MMRRDAFTLAPSAQFVSHWRSFPPAPAHHTCLLFARTPFSRFQLYGTSYVPAALMSGMSLISNAFMPDIILARHRLAFSSLSQCEPWNPFFVAWAHKAGKRRILTRDRFYCERPTRRTRSSKRGSERRGSRQGSILRFVSPSSCAL